MTWIGSFEGNPFLVEGELPIGWETRERPSPGFDGKIFAILGQDGVKKAEVALEMSSDSQEARVKVFSDEGGEASLAADREKFMELSGAYLRLASKDKRQPGLAARYAELQKMVEQYPSFRRSMVPKRHEAQSPEQVFDELMLSYQVTIRSTAGWGRGRGREGQAWIEAAHAKLRDFVKKHPEFASQLPEKHQCSNDGYMGASVAASRFEQTRLLSGSLDQLGDVGAGDVGEHL